MRMNDRSFVLTRLVRFAADGTESDTTYQNLIRISAFHSEAPRATAPAVPGAAKLTVPPAGMGAAVVRRDSIGFEVRFYFRAY